MEVATEKVLQFIMQLKPIYHKKLGLIQQKNVFLNTTEIFKQESVLIDIIFAMKIIFLSPFQSWPL